MKTTLSMRLAVAWILFVPLATLWQALTYSGLYRWLCEWQLAENGQYEAVMTAVLPAVLLIVPAVVYLRSRLPRTPPAPAKPLDTAAAERVVIRVLAVPAIGGALVCVGALLWASSLPGGSGPSVDVDLATLGDAVPPLGRVTLIGAVDAAHVARKAVPTKATATNGHHLYAPMIVPGSTGGTARIFVDEGASGSVAVPLPTAAGNRFRGVLVEGGLPNDMARQLARIGVRIGDPYYLLLTGPDGARTPYYVVAGLAGFVAFLGLLPLLLVLVGRMRRRSGPA